MATKLRHYLVHATRSEYSATGVSTHIRARSVADAVKRGAAHLPATHAYITATRTGR